MPTVFFLCPPLFCAHRYFCAHHWWRAWYLNFHPRGAHHAISQSDCTDTHPGVKILARANTFGTCLCCHVISANHNSGHNFHPIKIVGTKWGKKVGTKIRSLSNESQSFCAHGYWVQVGTKFSALNSADQSNVPTVTLLLFCTLCPQTLLFCRFSVLNVSYIKSVFNQ